MGVAVRTGELDIGGKSIGIDREQPVGSLLQLEAGIGHAVSEPLPAGRVLDVALFLFGEVVEVEDRVVE